MVAQPQIAAADIASHRLHLQRCSGRQTPMNSKRSHQCQHFGIIDCYVHAAHPPSTRLQGYSSIDDNADANITVALHFFCGQACQHAGALLKHMCVLNGMLAYARHKGFSPSFENICTRTSLLMNHSAKMASGLAGSIDADVVSARNAKAEHVERVDRNAKKKTTASSGSLQKFI